MDARIDELAASDIDMLLMAQASFADSTMVLQLAEAVPAPLLMWAFPEAQVGGRLRINSFCGINLAAHGLRRSGLAYNYVYAEPDDIAAHKKLHASLSPPASRGDSSGPVSGAWEKTLMASILAWSTIRACGRSSVWKSCNTSWSLSSSVFAALIVPK